MRTAKRLDEPIAIHDIYVSGLAEVDHIGGGNFRFTFYVIQGDRCIIRSRIVMHMEAVPGCITMTAKQVGVGISANSPNIPIPQ